MTDKIEECNGEKGAMGASVSRAHRDDVLADEARQAASAVVDGELCPILNVCARLLGVVTTMNP